jgi:uncharacterized protein (UPF0332 family)
MTTPEQLVAFAGKLVASHSHTTAALRAAISRAYYGAYHLTGDLLVEMGFSRGRQHNYHHDLLNSGQAEARLAGQLLENLRTSRNLADYELGNPRAEQLRYAQSCVEDAEKVQSLLSDCRQEPLRTAVKSGIEAYRQRIAPRS